MSAVQPLRFPFFLVVQSVRHEARTACGDVMGSARGRWTDQLLCFGHEMCVSYKGGSFLKNLQ